MKTIMLRLAEPLQSYAGGEPLPPWSLVAGIFAAAAGAERHEFPFTDMAVGVIRPGSRTSDFTSRSSNARQIKQSSAPKTSIRSRPMMEDADMVVAVTGPDEAMVAAHAALCAPQWSYFLGTKDMIPLASMVGPLLDADDPTKAILSSDAGSVLQSVWATVAEEDRRPGDRIVNDVPNAGGSWDRRTIRQVYRKPAAVAEDEGSFSPAEAALLKVVGRYPASAASGSVTGIRLAVSKVDRGGVEELLLSVPFFPAEWDDEAAYAAAYTAMQVWALAQKASPNGALASKKGRPIAASIARSIPESSHSRFAALLSAPDVKSRDQILVSLVRQSQGLDFDIISLYHDLCAWFSADSASVRNRWRRDFLLARPSR